MCFRPAGVARVMQCPECGAYNKPGNVVCQKCGKDFSEEIAAAEAAAAESMTAPVIPGSAPPAPGSAPPAPGNAPKAPGNAPRAPGNAPRPGGSRPPGAPPRPPSAAAPPPKV